MPDSSSSPVVGLVLGSQDATPLEFWFGVREGDHVQLDDLVVTRTTLTDGQTVTFYGIVDIVRKRFEGSQFDTDAFRVADGTLPADEPARVPERVLSERGWSPWVDRASIRRS